MAKYKNINYLSLPQQVEKNRKDIIGLDESVQDIIEIIGDGESLNPKTVIFADQNINQLGVNQGITNTLKAQLQEVLVSFIASNSSKIQDFGLRLNFDSTILVFIPDAFETKYEVVGTDVLYNMTFRGSGTRYIAVMTLIFNPATGEVLGTPEIVLNQRSEFEEYQLKLKYKDTIDVIEPTSQSSIALFKIEYDEKLGAQSGILVEKYNGKKRIIPFRFYKAEKLGGGFGVYQRILEISPGELGNTDDGMLLDSLPADVSNLFVFDDSSDEKKYISFASNYITTFEAPKYLGIHTFEVYLDKAYNGEITAEWYPNNDYMPPTGWQYQYTSDIILNPYDVSPKIFKDKVQAAKAMVDSVHRVLPSDKLNLTIDNGPDIDAPTIPQIYVGFTAINGSETGDITFQGYAGTLWKTVRIQLKVKTTGGNVEFGDTMTFRFDGVDIPAWLKSNPSSNTTIYSGLHVAGFNLFERSNGMANTANRKLAIVTLRVLTGGSNGAVILTISSVDGTDFPIASNANPWVNIF